MLIAGLALLIVGGDLLVRGFELSRGVRYPVAQHRIVGALGATGRVGLCPRNAAMTLFGLPAKRYPVSFTQVVWPEGSP